MYGSTVELFQEALERDLTGEQSAALDSEARYKCISAAAGSGKTRTLVYAIMKELISGVPPQGVVAFTFTEKAAFDCWI